MKRARPEVKIGPRQDGLVPGWWCGLRAVRPVVVPIAGLSLLGRQTKRAKIEPPVGSAARGYRNITCAPTRLWRPESRDRGSDHDTQGRLQAARRLGSLGRVARERPLYDRNERLRSFDLGLTLSRAASDRVTQARSLFGLSRTAAALGELNTARERVEGALSVAESLRSATESRELRASFLAATYLYYELRVDILMRLHAAHPREDLAAEAFRASEAARARSLLDGLRDSGVDLRQGVEPGLLAREQASRLAFDGWAERQRRFDPSGADPATSRALADEYRGLEEQYEQIQAEIRRKSPRYADLVQPRPLTLEDVQGRVLDDDTILLEYFLGDQRSYLWVVSKHAYSAHTLPPREAIEQAARRIYGYLTSRLILGDHELDQGREADADYWKEAARLSEVLLGPAADRLAGKTLLVVPDGALQYLPFAALPLPGRKDRTPLVAEHVTVNLPSATVLAVIRQESRNRKAPDRAVAVLADPIFESDDPRLPARPVGSSTARRLHPADEAATSEDGETGGGPSGFPRLLATRREAAAVLSVAPEGAMLRAVASEASRATAMSPELAHYRIVHFATHGVLDNESPGRSGIVLSLFDSQGRPQDGFLRLHDLYELNLPVEMVVLSACETALGRQLRGEGLVGVVRGFMHAGAKRVVASLWKVDDEATVELMRIFYAGMLKDGRSPAEALRRAQIALRRRERWRSPYYWAGFVLQGEPG